MISINHSSITLTDGFWKQKQDLIRNVTTGAVYDRFKETGRFDAFRCDWKEGDPNRPHIFWDSDVAKWIEGVAYLVEKEPMPEFEAIVDEVVELMDKNRLENGYYNSYFITIAQDEIFKVRDKHELYCAGHLIEAAIAYCKATGKRKMLDIMCDYVDYIEKRFYIDRDTAFITPGHEEIELALVKLYEFTEKEKYLELAKFFVNMRGTEEEQLIGNYKASYSQSHLPVREQTTAEGHAVRAVYLFCAMADLGYITEDSTLISACKTLFENIITKRMYITGGIGSSSSGEAFTVDYDLSNLFAYTESCAALGLALFANRMLRIENDSRYSDVIERVIYNGFLSSLSLDGRAFFYENPLEIIPDFNKRNVSAPVSSRTMHMPSTTRKEVFSCSCCPPNITRFISSISDFIYTANDDTLFLHQYMSSVAEIKVGGKTVRIEQKTNYPSDGKIHISVDGAPIKLAVRIPYFSKAFATETLNGYAYFELSDGEELDIDLGMPTYLVEARPDAIFDCGRFAVMRGPVVYCMEGIDNGELLRDIRLDSSKDFEVGYDDALGIPTLSVNAFKRKNEESTPLYYEKTESFVDTTAKLIPYYAFANRGETPMQVWHLVK